MAGRLREGEKEEVGRKRRDGRRRQISWCVVTLQKTCPALWAVLRVPTAGHVPASLPSEAAGHSSSFFR